jgi:hypothetical protein
MKTKNLTPQSTRTTARNLALSPDFGVSGGANKPKSAVKTLFTGGLEARAIEIGKRLGVDDLRRTGFVRRHEHGQRVDFEPAKIIGTAAPVPAPFDKDFVAKAAKRGSATLATKEQITELRAIEVRCKTIREEMLSSALSTEVFRRRIAEDEQRLGTPEYKAYTRDRDRLYQDLCSELSAHKWRLRQESSKALPIVVQISTKLSETLEKLLNQRLETEIQDAIQWGCFFRPSIILANLDLALEQLKEERGWLSGPNANLIEWRDCVFSIPAQLIEK